MTPATDDGYFPRGTSVLRRVHQERSVGLMYGQRALAIGAIAPLNFVGTLLHTRARDRPFQRLAHTGKMFETIFFGTRAEADEVLEKVNRLHYRVKGELPEPAGSFPAGTPYSAYNPGMMLWTIAVMADSARVFYELFVRRLCDDERDALWRDYVRFGELFGMPRDAAPASHAEFTAYWEERLSASDAFLTEEARNIGLALLFHIPVPLSRSPGMPVHNLIMLGALPPPVRRLYDLRWTPAHAAAFAAVVSGVRASRPITPRMLRTGHNTAHFDLVARTERSLIARGKPVPGALS